MEKHFPWSGNLGIYGLNDTQLSSKRLQTHNENLKKVTVVLKCFPNSFGFGALSSMSISWNWGFAEYSSGDTVPAEA